jgi:methylenetetrahydrofolate reductase (NADPH)
MGAMTAAPPGEALAGLLLQYSTEVTARDRRSIEAAPALLPKGSEVFIAAVPGESPGEMIAAAAQLRAAGLVPVPHIVARNFPGLKDVDRVLGRLADEAGVDHVLALGGDRDRPAGELHCSLQLIESGLFGAHGVRRLFIACYPEGHPRVADEVLEEARAAKLRAIAEQGLDATLISQFCFEAAPIIALARRMRCNGPKVPYRVGVAGPAARTTLVKYALMCGIGPSLRGLKQRQALARNVLAGETPEALLAEVGAARLEDPGLNIAGVHFFTFGALARSAEWAEKMRR